MKNFFKEIVSIQCKINILKRSGPTMMITGQSQVFYGVVSILNLIWLVLSIYITWNCLREARWDKVFLDPSDLKARGFVLIISIVIGTMLADFFTTYLTNSLYLKFIF